MHFGIRIVQLMGYWVFYETITPPIGEYFMEGLRWGVEEQP
jgi:L-ribulose-5-phosphate 3-epimerase UlaE